MLEEWWGRGCVEEGWWERLTTAVDDGAAAGVEGGVVLVEEGTGCGFRTAYTNGVPVQIEKDG